MLSSLLNYGQRPNQQLSEKALKRVMHKTPNYPMDLDPYTRVCHRLLDELKRMKPQGVLSRKGENEWFEHFWEQAHGLLMSAIGKSDLKYWYETYPKLVNLELEFAETALQKVPVGVRSVMKLKLGERAELLRALATLRARVTPMHVLIEEITGDFLESYLKMSYAEVDQTRKLRDDYFYTGDLVLARGFFDTVRTAYETVDVKPENVEEYLDRADVAFLMLEIDG